MLEIGRLVAGWVATSESLLLYAFLYFSHDLPMLLCDSYPSLMLIEQNDAHDVIITSDAQREVEFERSIPYVGSELW